MTNYFLGSYIVTAIGLVGAFMWGEHTHSGTGFSALFIVMVLAVLEVSLSFDNAIVNAMKLEKMDKVWRARFLTWGILIAVFGMRFIFPAAVVDVFSPINIVEVMKIAFTDADTYAGYLKATHAPIVTFGGIFLIMLFVNYFFNRKKEVHWIDCFEKPASAIGNVRGIEIVVPLIILIGLQHILPVEEKLRVLISGLFGIIVFLLIDGISHFLEKREEMRNAQCLAEGVKCAGLISFIYLELIDASFSLDGVLGAFALSNDILIITIGLAIGAMFVRSLTLLLVEKKTLAKFLYLEHGAHWAIGALAVIMLVTTFREVPEVVTGLIGLFFIVTSLISSILHNKKMNDNQIADENEVLTEQSTSENTNDNL